MTDERTPFQILEAETRGSAARQMLAMLILRYRDSSERYRCFKPIYGEKHRLVRDLQVESEELWNLAETARRTLYGWTR